MSRNRFIVRALEKAVEEIAAWSPGFLEELAGFDLIDEDNELLGVIRQHRRSKGSIEL